MPLCRPAVVGTAACSRSRGSSAANKVVVDDVPRKLFTLVARTLAGRDRAAAPTASFGFFGIEQPGCFSSQNPRQSRSRTVTRSADFANLAIFGKIPTFLSQTGRGDAGEGRQDSGPRWSNRSDGRLPFRVENSLSAEQLISCRGGRSGKAGGTNCSPGFFTSASPCSSSPCHLVTLSPSSPCCKDPHDVRLTCVDAF